MKVIARKPRVWEANVPTTAMVYGEFDQWPPEMQDQIYQATERITLLTGIKSLEILQCICLKDEIGYYAKITVMEQLGPEDVIVIH